jgi:ribosomal protein S18 acetylase RimI-like enzyme
MTGGLTIRRATGADVEEILPVAVDMATSFVVDPERFRESFQALLARDDAIVLVAEEGGGIVGYLLGFDHLAFYANGRVAYVEEVAVRQDRRRQKIGQRLMQEFETWSRLRSSVLVTLATRRAAPFYGALEYEETATLFRKML